MNNEIFEKIQLMIVDKMGKYRKPLMRETTLEKDLGMSGDDAVEFILEFSKKFNVDVSKFEIKKYFFPEGDSVLPAIIRFFAGKKNPKQKELTLGDLEKAVIAGRLDEEVING
jgi:acyl carrier protein